MGHPNRPMSDHEILMSLNDAVGVSPPSFDVPPPPLSKGEREYRAFQRLLPQLLTAHRGKYVAIHEEQPVDSDADDVVLILRVHARFGYVPIHVGLVTDTPAPPIHVPPYRLYLPGAALTEDSLEARARRGSRKKFEAALKTVPDVAPEEFDRLPPPDAP